MTAPLDDVDRRLLAELQRDARASLTALAAAITGELARVGSITTGVVYEVVADRAVTAGPSGRT